MSWISNLSVGEQVIVSGHSPQLGKVNKFTKTLVFVECNGYLYRFRISDGREPGKIFQAFSLHPVTIDLVQKANRVQIIDRIKSLFTDTRLAAASDTQLMDLLNILRRIKQRSALSCEPVGVRQVCKNNLPGY